MPCTVHAEHAGTEWVKTVPVLAKGVSTKTMETSLDPPLSII